MWSPFVLCLLVGFAYASTSPAWKENTEYVYLVKGRTLSSLHEASNQYSGMFLKAKLCLTLRSDGKLQGRISDAQYSQIQSHLPNGWDSEVPESQMSYKKLPLSEQPFQMILEDGLIIKLIVEKALSNWEANIIKSIMSQFQWDVQGKSAIESSINNLPTNDRFDGVFKVMEETVTGKTETLYEIHPLPEYLLQSKPWWPVETLQEDDQIVEIVKSKNYTNAEERPSYHYGFAEVEESEPTSNKMGTFFVRESFSRAVITGKPSNFVIHKTYTVNKILVNPTFNNKEMGSIISMVNVTLSKLNTQSQEPTDLSDPVEIGDLVYTYESPFAQHNGIHDKQYSAQYKEDFSEETVEKNLPRYRRYASQQLRRRAYERPTQDTHQYQPRPQMGHAPESPLLPYLVGYQGRSIKTSQDFDIKLNVQKLIVAMAKEVQDPQEILRQSTMNKYTILSTLIRLLNEEEIKTLAKQFETQSSEGQERLPFDILFDAIAEAGTGPALSIVKEFIQSEKIKGFQAAEIVNTMAHAARVPTEEYMRTFYELVNDPQVREQDYLNETAILSYTDLVYKVYIAKNESHNQFPVHSFGSFNTKEGRQFVFDSFIPYLTQQLHDAITQADSRKIHVYIRALGNVGHKRILEAFEPYLEGQKQASQFQRMMMVVALDRLIDCNPAVGRSVCYKIYQNTGETPEIRVVAVHQIFKSNPPVEMLQHMAESTHTESQGQVVAAIKSAIESASLLEASEHQVLQEAAQSAKSLLTEKYYSGDNSFIHLQDYIINNMDVEFHHKFLEIGSQDSYWPKTVNLAVRGNLNGMHHKYFKVSALTSSVSELLKVLYRQTEEYQQVKTQRFQHRSGESQWSSANIAELLNYESEEREQLEGVIVAEMESFQKLFAFDNQTIEGLPKFVQEKEELLKNGKPLTYIKFRQVEEKALSFPTEMGFPFMFTYDVPMMIRIDGNIKAAATPQISTNGKLHTPDQITAELDAQVTISRRVQSDLRFVTPFDSQVYLAGYAKNIQVHVPIKANVVVNIKACKQIDIKFDVKDTEKDTSLFHYSTWPYTSRSDLMDINPVALRSHTQVIEPKVSQHRYFDVILGKKETGMAFRVWGHHPVQSINFRELVEIMQSQGTQGLLNMWQQLWDKAVLQQTKINIAFIPSQSSVRQFTLRLAKLSQYTDEPEIQTEEDYLTYSQLASKLENDELPKRQEEMLKYVSSGIRSVKSSAYDVSVEFEGDKTYQHTLGLAFAKSDAGPKSRILAYYMKNAEEQKQLAVQVKAKIPNTNGLGITDSLNTEPQAQYEVRLRYGNSEEDASVVSGQVHSVRSQERKKYLTEEEPLYEVCKTQMQRGDFQLSACQNLTIRLNFLDDIKIELEHKKLKKEYVSIIEGIFKGMRVYYYPMTEIKTVQSQEENKVYLRIQFQPEDFGQVNFTVKAEDEETKLFNLTIPNQIVKALVVPHPVFHLKSRLAGVLRKWENFRPTCVIDQTAAQTFSNKTYRLTLENKYTVALLYAPKEARLNGETTETVKDMLRRNYENYLVLVRQLSANQKELMITFNHKETQGKTVEINLKPKLGKRSATNCAATVLVNNQAIQFDDEKIANLYNGIVQVYALPNGEVKIEFKDAFYLIYDGQRFKVTVTGSKLFDSTTGLCGRFSKDKYEDFTTPSKCVVRDSSEFIRSYFVDASRVPYRSPRSNILNRQCVSKVMPLYADVVSDRDAGRQNSLPRTVGSVRSVSKLRHRYVEVDGEICFSVRPLPACSTYAGKMVSKQVPVHCIAGSKTAYYLKNQIDQGGNPDFSHKTETRKIRMEIPLECSTYYEEM